jgi:hypothetical protein
MEFYQHRTVDEQADRLPEKYRENFKRTQIDRIKIDGETIQGYFDYSFLEEKSYVEQPIRSNDGSVDVENYNTFLTPRIIIRYNMMGIEDYRALMKKLKTKNAFSVTCYDLVEDKIVTHEMYCAPSQMPIIYHQYLMALGIKEHTIELIGTNNVKDIILKYHINREGYDFLPSERSLKRNEPHKLEDSLYWEKDNGYTVTSSAVGTLLSWNTMPNGEGVSYSLDNNYYFSKDIDLYAQWR